MWDRIARQTVQVSAVVTNGTSYRYLLFLSLLFFCCLQIPSVSFGAEKKLTVYTFDIGQGDALLIQTPTGRNILVDAGPPESGPGLADRLTALGIQQLDIVIMTHPHLDHMGGMLRAIRKRKVKLFLDPMMSFPSPPYERLLVEIKRRKEKRAIRAERAKAGRILRLGGGVEIEILAPPENLLSGTRSDANANSIVFMLSYKEFRLLFTGDAEKETELELLKDPLKLNATVLKMAHHGSSHSSIPKFLDAVSPEIALISAGKGNDYKHPHPKALQRLQMRKVKIYRTDLHGTIRLTSDGLKTKVDIQADPKEIISSILGPAPPKEFIAHAKSAVFHRANCILLQGVPSKHLVRFRTYKKAKRSGREPARDCILK